MPENTPPDPRPNRRRARSSERIFKAAQSSARRARRTLLAIQVFSLLVAALIFNTLPGNWTDSRIATLSDARLLLGQFRTEFLRAAWRVAGAKSPDSAEIATLPPAADTAWTFLQLESATTRTFDSTRVALWKSLGTRALRERGLLESTRSVEDRLNRAAELVLSRGYNRTDVERLLDVYQRARVEHVAGITVPLIGVRIDSNGLGLLAEFGYSVLLFWLLLTLKRECANIRWLLEHQYVRDVIAIRMETLFAFHDHNERNVRGGSKGAPWLPTIALGIPMLLLTAQLVFDFRTKQTGALLSPDLTNLTLLLEGLLLVINTGFAIACVREHQQLVWRIESAFENDHDLGIA